MVEMQASSRGVIALPIWRTPSDTCWEFTRSGRINQSHGRRINLFHKGIWIRYRWHDVRI